MVLMSIVWLKISGKHTCTLPKLLHVNAFPDKIRKYFDLIHMLVDLFTPIHNM